VTATDHEFRNSKHWEHGGFTGIYIYTEKEEGLPLAIQQVADPLSYHEQTFAEASAEWREKGCHVREVVIRVGDEERELSFAQFREEYVGR
jgi:hypothetical protein